MLFSAQSKNKIKKKTCKKNTGMNKSPVKAGKKANPTRKKIRGNQRRRGEDGVNKRIRTHFYFQGLTEGHMPVSRKANSV